MSGFRIRPGRPEDLPAIAGLIRGLAEYERLAHAVEFDDATLGRFLFGPRAYAETLLAVEEVPGHESGEESGEESGQESGHESGEAFGLALFFHNFSTFLGRPGIYLEDLFVRPEHRGRGAGRALLAALAALAVERECGRLEWSVLDWNRPAIDFYERLGARPNSEWTTYRLAGEALRGLASM